MSGGKHADGSTPGPAWARKFQRRVFAGIARAETIASLVGTAMFACVQLTFHPLGIFGSSPADDAITLAAWVAASLALGTVVLRVGSRALPLYASGRRNTAAIAILVGVLVVSVLAAIGPLMEAVRALRQPAPNDLGGLVASGVIQVAAGYWVLTIILWSTAIGLPLASLLAVHLGGSRWAHGRVVLFLRRFSGVSNTAALGPLVRGLPKGVRVALLSAPANLTASWDVASLGVAGFSMRRPFSSIPVYLVSDGASWQHDVGVLAARASVIVIDVDDMSDALAEELEIVRAPTTRSQVLYLSSAGNENPVLREASQVVAYRVTRLAAVPSLAITLGLTWMAWLLLRDFFWPSLPGWIGGVVGSLRAVVFSPKQGYSVASSRTIAAKLRTMLS